LITGVLLEKVPPILIIGILPLKEAYLVILLRAVIFRAIFLVGFP